MKHLYTLLFIFLLIQNLSFAQPKVPLEFKNTQPKWQHYSYDPKLPRFLQLHEQEGKPLVINKDIYLLHNIFNNENEGYLVENIDAETGLTKWRDSYYATKYNTRRYAAPLTQKGNKIEMYYFQEWNNEKPVISWNKSRFNRIDYCADSGKKCDSLITDVNDTLNTTLIMPQSSVNIFSYNGYISKNKNNVQYVKYQGAYDKPNKQNYAPFYILRLDSLGHKVDSNYVQINTKYTIRTVNLKKYQEGKYVCLICATSSNKLVSSPKEVKLVYFDADFNVEKTVDVTAFMPPFNFCNFAYVDENNIILSAVTSINKNGFDVHKISSILFKSSGEFVKSTTFNNYELNFDNYDRFNITFLPKSKQEVLINSRRQNVEKKTDIEILATNSNGGFNLLKTIPTVPNGYLSVSGATLLGDSSLLLMLKYADTSSRNYFDAVCQWSLFALFPLSSLGLTTSSQEIITDNQVSYFPNPTYSSLNINSQIEYNQIKVYSVEGKLMVQNNNTSGLLNTDMLHSGIYFFELWQNDKIVSHKLKFVKIE